MVKKLLVVDDEKIIHDTIDLFFRGTNIEIEHAYTAQEGLDNFDAKTSWIVLTDMRMPGMNGTELVKCIKDISPKTPVIVMTAYGSPESEQASKEAGAFFCLHKPFTDQEVEKLVETILQL